MLINLSDEQLERLKVGKPIGLPNYLPNCVENCEAEPDEELTPDDIAQAKIELECSDTELKGMDA